MRRRSFSWAERNPPASPQDRRRARRTAAAVAAEWVRRGAEAVVLAGSWARGDAHRESDIDLWVVGRARRPRILWREGFMVTVSSTTEGVERRKLRRPPALGGTVPGWRRAVPLHDPRGIAGRLRAEARRFRWESVGRECDRWVATQTVGWAEEAIKLVRALATGNRATAAVQRNLLADGLGFVVAIHRRMFWDSENELWERVGGAVGGEWASAQRDALLGGFGASCSAALVLYARTAEMVRGVLNAEQASLVAHACEVAGEKPWTRASPTTPAPLERGGEHRRERAGHR